MNKLTIADLQNEALKFCTSESLVWDTELYGVSDGKKIGTRIEHKFKEYLASAYDVTIGSSATGLDLPDPWIETDIKVTSIQKPQSSCPFKNARDKIFGLGYNLLVFVYVKHDDSAQRASRLDFISCSYVPKAYTGDYSTTRILNDLKQAGSEADDIIAFLTGINLPLNEAYLNELAEEILTKDFENGCITISNAMQWRLSFSWICPNSKGKIKPLKTIAGAVNLVHKVNS